MRTSENIDKISAALVAAQGDLAPVVKNCTNPHFRSKYADLAAVCEACLPSLHSNGLAIMQTAETDDAGRMVVRCRVVHTSGQWMENSLSMRPGKDDPQGAMAALTYGRRGTLMALVGLAPEDDDGNTASKVPAATEEQQKRIAILCGDLGLTKRDDRMEAINKWLHHEKGRRVASTKQLTKAEASNLITRLEEKVRVNIEETNKEDA